MGGRDLTDIEFNWKDVFTLFSDDEDFQREFNKIKASKRARNTYLNYLKEKLDSTSLEAIKKHKKRRHDRRKKIEKETQENFDDKKRQEHLREW